MVSYIGYETVHIPVGGKKNINVVIKENNEQLNEVIVVGYGTQKKATLTGSVSQVSGDDIKKLSSANLTNTLAGKTAGIKSINLKTEPCFTIMMRLYFSSVISSKKCTGCRFRVPS